VEDLKGLQYRKINAVREQLAEQEDTSVEQIVTIDYIRAFTLRLHAFGCSLRETAAILELLCVERTHGAVWNRIDRVTDSLPDRPSAQPTRVTVNETDVQINGE
jgi:hypothetical protein